MNIGENVNLIYYLLIFFSFLNSRLLNNIIKSKTVQCKYCAWLSTFDRCSSFCVIHEWEFTKKLSSFVCLQISLFTIYHLRAIILARSNNVEHISSITLFNYFFLRKAFNLFHSINDNRHVFLREGLKHYWFFQKTSQKIRRLFAFCNNLGNK